MVEKVIFVGKATKNRLMACPFGWETMNWALSAAFGTQDPSDKELKGT